MKVRLLVGGVLVDEAESTYGELYTEHNVSVERGEYLVSIGAAEEVKPAKKVPAKADPDAEKKDEPKTEAPAAPARKPAPRTK